jgi:asparagine synthetase B (glutamine-hydrolysing)
MFALLLWNAETRVLLAARDHIGVKPLYYTVHNGQLLFASEIKALLTERDVPRRIDYDALQAYLRVRYVPAPKTMFQGIYKLLPGHQMVIQQGQIRTEQYWDLTFSDEPLSERQCLDELEKLWETGQIETYSKKMKSTLDRERTKITALQIDPTRDQAISGVATELAIRRGEVG